jgi:chromosome segregation ATPase
MMGSSAPQPGGDVMSLLAAIAADPAGMQDRFRQLTELQAAIDTTRAEALTAEANARRDREAAEVLHADMKAREADLAAREAALLRAQESLSDNQAAHADRVDRAQRRIAERDAVLTARETDVDRREREVEQSAAVAERDMQAASAAALEWQTKIDKLRSFLASL